MEINDTKKYIGKNSAMAWQSYLTRRNVTFFSIFALGGSYLITKSRALAEKRRQQLAGDYHVRPDRSGGGI